MISCLMFDLDGTLFDQFEANGKAYAAALAAIGLPFDDGLYKKVYGLRFKEMMAHLAPNMDEAQHSQVKSLKTKFYKENFHLVKPNHGLLEFLKGLGDTYTTALVTTARKPNVMNLLKHFSVDTKLFTTIVTGEDVTHGKPDPECYVRAMGLLGKTPQDCLVFEDSDVGVEAAKRAGTHFVRVRI